MLIQPLDTDRPGHLHGFHQAYLAAHAHVPGPKLTRPHFVIEVTEGPPGGTAEAWVVTEGDEVTGGYAMSFPEDDNRHMAWLFPLVVRPERRGAGLGSALFEHALGRVRARGRRLLLTETPSTGVGARFARAHGMDVSLEQARRVLDLRTADWAALDRLTPEVEGYDLEHWTGPARTELHRDLATLMNGMNDAPRDADVEDAAYTPERVRAAEENLARIGETCHTTIARRRDDGAPAGLTRIYLRADRSDAWGNQGDTTVLPEHRGHRLGLLLKLANLRSLREHEPHVEQVITWNAVSNRHMIAINEAMGFTVLDHWPEWRLDVTP
uniref:GNAT family N-acetyltransferase n=1 Tax=Nonomuraea pusilla TaxID=46177 RepID=UPI0006E25B95|nr:GNAT family N-acetyltransferase [Nonomuraea pusilla]